VRRRILVAILSVAAVAIVLFGVPLAIVVQRFVDNDAALRVERAAVLAARQVPAEFATSNDPVELPDGTDGISLALYDGRGSLVAGTGPDRADGATMRALDNEVIDVTTSGARIVAVPVAADERVVGVIRAEQSTAASQSRTRRIIALLGALAVGVLIVGGAIGYVLAGRLAQPVRRLRDAAVRLGHGDFAIEVPRSRVPELDEAAEAMTVTARRLDNLVSRERSFSADASHQLRTPLAGLRAAIETELNFPRPDPTVLLHEALSDIDRLERTIGELLTIARTPAILNSCTSLADVFADVEESWRSRVAMEHRSLRVASARYAPPVVGNAPMLRHALDVLLDNALRHGAGTIAIDLTITDESVTITLSDEGPGFTLPPSATDGTNFDPFDGAVHGLGLPLARRLVDAMPGRLLLVRSGPRPQLDILLRRSAPAAQ
jgi:signal transduction histidine kinase